MPFHAAGGDEAPKSSETILANALVDLQKDLAESKKNQNIIMYVLIGLVIVLITLVIFK